VPKGWRAYGESEPEYSIADVIPWGKATSFSPRCLSETAASRIALPLFLKRMPPFQDVLVCGISTQLQQAVPELDETITPFDPDFGGSGLKAASLIRLGYLAILPRSRSKGAAPPSLPAMLHQ